VIPDEVKAFFKDRIMGKFKYADSKLAGQDYLMGKQFTVADGYLFVMLKWAERTGMDLSALKNLTTFKDRVAARPNVQAALQMEAQAQKAA
jgi:glutathione S-transferase